MAGTSSADPEDLDRFATRSAGADRTLRDAFARVQADYRDFTAGTSWAVLDADGLMSGFTALLGLNDRDVAWAQQVAGAFRRAGRGGGVRSLPDAALDASLRAAGLSGDRADLTVDLPEAYGEQPTSGYADDPVNTASGSFLEVETDLDAAGLLAGLRFARTYNSRDTSAGVFGQGWTCWADARLVARPDGAHLRRPDGARVVVPRDGDGFRRVPALAGRVEPEGDGLAVASVGGARWVFDAAGLPLSTSSGPGTLVRFETADGQVTALVHTSGRRLDLVREAGRAVALQCSDGRRITYSYDEQGRLIGATGGPRGARTYRYGDDGLVAAVVDADGVVEVDNAYDAQGRVVEQRSPAGRVSTYTYLPGRVTVVQDDAGRAPNTWVADPAGRLLGVVDAHGQRQSTGYDADGNPVVITDRRGATTVQQFDDRGRLVRRVLPGGAELQTTYDDADRVVETLTSTGLRTVLRYEGEERTPSEVVDPDGGRTLLEVSGGLVHALTDPDGVALRFGHDDAGLLVSVTAADGTVTRLERDPAGRVTAVVAPSGRRTAYRHDDRGLLAERVDPDGAVWRFEHSDAGRLLAVTDPTGARTEQAHGPDGQLARSTDPLGRTTERAYDDAGNLTGLVLPDGAKWQFVHDGLSRLVQVVDPAGGSWLREHDPEGALVGVVDPVGTRWTVQVDAAGRPVEVGDADVRVGYEYDVLGRAVAERRPDGSRVEVERDGCGRVVAVRDPEGGLTRYERTAGGRLARVVLPTGRSQRYEHDALGRLAAVVDDLGGRTALRHDEDGRLVTVTGPDGGQEHRTHDAAGRLATLSRPGLGVTTYRYDPAGRLVEVSDRTHGRRRFRYDAAGRVVEAQDANGGVTRYARDLSGRAVQVTDAEGGVVARRYDEVGRLVAEVDPLGHTTTVVHDAAGRVVERVDGAGQRLRWAYDAGGRLRALSTDDGELLRVERDVAGRRLRVVDPGGVSELRWDACDRLVERRRGELGLGWRYDLDGRRTALVHPDGRATSYEHDAAGRVTALVHPAAGRVELVRDAGGRLVEARGAGLSARWERSPDGPTRYEVAAAGRTRVTEVLRDELGRLASLLRDGTTTRVGYDPGGRLVSVDVDGTLTSYAYDACGRLVRETTHDRTTTYAYDAAGRLVRVQHPDGTATEVEHDGAGRRTAERHPARTRTCAWDARGLLTAVETPAGRTALEVDGLGELVGVDGVPVLWDTADPLSPLLHVGGTDLLGEAAPWALLQGDDATWLAPDERGTPAAGLDPWGAGAPGPVLPAGLSLGLHGELQVQDLLWLRARPYDPSTRQFLAPDPLPPVPGSGWAGAPWSYAGDDPLGSSDPRGLRPVTDAELAQFRADLGRNAFERHKEVVIGGVLVVAGGVLIATGVGGPAGIMLVSAGADVIIQKATTGEVNWGRAVAMGAVGGAGGVFAMAGAGVKTAMAGGAMVGGAFSTSAYYATEDDPTPEGALASFLGGAVAGGASALAGPVSGSTRAVVGAQVHSATGGRITTSTANTVAEHGVKGLVNAGAGAGSTVISNGLDPGRDITVRDLVLGAVIGAGSGAAGDALQPRIGHASPGTRTLSQVDAGGWGVDEVLVPAMLGGGVEYGSGVSIDRVQDLVEAR